MTPKQVDDYLQEGIYGTRLPNQAERERFLGTLKERVVLALTTGQVMTDKGIQRLEDEIIKNPKAKLIFNGEIDAKFLQSEKHVADRYHVPYSIINNVEVHTDIGAVLHYDYAVDADDIFLSEEEIPKADVKTNPENNSLLQKLKRFFL